MAVTKLPCPFCGCADRLRLVIKMPHLRRAVFCEWCCAVGPSWSIRSDAVTAWNKALRPAHAEWHAVSKLTRKPRMSPVELIARRVLARFC